jgi:hypothetical protein
MITRGGGALGGRSHLLRFQLVVGVSKSMRCISSPKIPLERRHIEVIPKLTSPAYLLGRQWPVRWYGSDVWVSLKKSPGWWRISQAPRPVSLPAPAGRSTVAMSHDVLSLPSNNLRDVPVRSEKQLRLVTSDRAPTTALRQTGRSITAPLRELNLRQVIDANLWLAGEVTPPPETSTWRRLCTANACALFNLRHPQSPATS